jgi:hypothetical protein
LLGGLDDDEGDPGTVAVSCHELEEELASAMVLAVVEVGEDDVEEGGRILIRWHSVYLCGRGGREACRGG